MYSVQADLVRAMGIYPFMDIFNVIFDIIGIVRKCNIVLNQLVRTVYVIIFGVCVEPYCCPKKLQRRPSNASMRPRQRLVEFNRDSYKTKKNTHSGPEQFTLMSAPTLKPNYYHKHSFSSFVDRFIHKRF